MRESQREPADERFGTNLRAIRERAGISQSGLADAMNERGHTWHQQTVGRIEAGRQSARIGEAEDIAAILKTSVDRLMWTTQEASAGIFLDMTIARAENGFEQITTGTAELLWAQHQLEVSVGEAERAGCYGSDRVRVIVAEARAVLELTPEDAVGSGRKHHEELRATGERCAEEAGYDTQGES
jgi:transcriptional regulator with XRE-family HTH domain